MALTADQIKFIASGQGGGGQALFDMVNAGTLSSNDVVGALGQDAVNNWLQQTGNTLPGSTPAPAVTPATPKPVTPTNPTPMTLGSTQTVTGNYGTSTTQNTGNTSLPINNTPTGYPTPIPAAPQYQQAAAGQGTANLDAAKNTVALSNPDVNSTYGSQTLSVGPDGRPVINQSLSPEQQARLDQLNPVLTGAGSRVADELANPIRSYVTQEFGAPSLDNLSARTVNPTAGGASSIAEALRSREQPRLDRQRSQLQSQLLARGFNPNDEAYKAAMDELNRSENDFNLGLIDRSGQEQSRLFNLESALRDQQRTESGDLFNRQLTRRQNQVNEGLTLRGLPLDEYSKLMQILPQLPQFQAYQGANVDAAPVFNAANAQGIFDLGRYGTMIQGELGTRGIDASKGIANTQLLTNLAGAFI